jgi:ABC-type multidrug transport system ATPase subunit
MFPGKTTTVSMLTGLLERTAGDATIYGNSLSNGIDSIRQLLGICPQHDVLFDYLTIGEHIDLFARLKGATLEEMEREREAMLAAFELKPREDFFPVGLSGGMKRKACVALALTGDTRLCILDEPTTGLDPGARRRLWDTLAMLKRGIHFITSFFFVFFPFR